MSTDMEQLKRKAQLLGIRYHANITEEKLREKVREAMKDSDEVTESSSESVSLTKEQMIAEKRKAAGVLVRINAVCMNPNKKNWTGEYISAGNSQVGTFKKFVQFNTPDGWHVPQIILNVLQERKCQVFFNTTTASGKKIRKGKLIKEFSIEILPPLTEVELKDLATKQAMANSLAD